LFVHRSPFILLASLILTATTCLAGAAVVHAAPSFPTPASDRVHDAISHTNGSCTEVTAALRALPEADRNALGSAPLACREGTGRPTESSRRNGWLSQSSAAAGRVASTNGGPVLYFPDVCQNDVSFQDRFTRCSGIYFEDWAVLQMPGAVVIGTIKLGKNEYQRVSPVSTRVERGMIVSWGEATGRGADAGSSLLSNAGCFYDPSVANYTCQSAAEPATPSTGVGSFAISGFQTFRVTYDVNVPVSTFGRAIVGLDPSPANPGWLSHLGYGQTEVQECDFDVPGAQTAGCAFYYSPATWVFNPTNAGRVAYHMNAAMQMGLPGSPASGRPLHRLIDVVAAENNRTIACRNLPSARLMSCDEYPFASTYEGAATSTVYLGWPATRVTQPNCSYNLPIPATLAQGISVCRVPALQNSSQGGQASAFYLQNRYRDWDPFYVEVGPQDPNCGGVPCQRPNP